MTIIRSAPHERPPARSSPTPSSSAQSSQSTTTATKQSTISLVAFSGLDHQEIRIIQDIISSDSDCEVVPPLPSRKKCLRKRKSPGEPCESCRCNDKEAQSHHNHVKKRLGDKERQVYILKEQLTNFQDRVTQLEGELAKRPPEDIADNAHGKKKSPGKPGLPKWVVSSDHLERVKSRLAESEEEVSNLKGQVSRLERQVSKLEEEKEGFKRCLDATTALMKDERQCKICFQRDADTTLLPCLHSSTCRQCVRELKVEPGVGKCCPFCRRPILTIGAIYRV